MSELPNDVVNEARRLTRLARDAVDEEEAKVYRDRRDEIVGEHDFVARVREEDTRDVLVLHPDGWIEDGTVDLDQIDDTDRADEIHLAGAGPEGRFDEVEEHNRNVVAAVEARAGDDHAANAAAFADFMGNHYVRRVESATDTEVREFLEEYYPRNVWPTDEQRETVVESIRLVFEIDGSEPPPVLHDEN